MQVLQHMSPPLQQMYIEQFCDVLRIGGRGWAHLLGQEPKDEDSCGVDVSGEFGHKILDQSTSHNFPVRDLPVILQRRGCVTMFNGFPEGQHFPYYITFFKCSMGPLEPGAKDSPECAQ